MQISKITSKKVIIPTLLLAGSIAIANTINNKNNISTESTLEYMDKNPVSQGAKAGILSLFGLCGAKRRKETESESIEPETKIINNKEDWDKIRMPLMSLATDLYYEKEETDEMIDKLIEKLDNESVDKELGKYAQKGLKFIKEHSEDIVYVDISCTGSFEDGAKELYWSVFHSTKAALYPDLVNEKQKQALPKWIKLGNAYMSESS